MSGSRRTPARTTPLAARLLPPLLALAALLGVGGWILALRPPPEDPVALLAAAPAVEAGARPGGGGAGAVERSWIGEALEPHYLAAPVGPPPCPGGLRTVGPSLRSQVAAALARDGEAAVAALDSLARSHPGSWLPALAEANLLLRQGEPGQAEIVLDRYLGSAAGERLVRSVSGAVRGGGGPATEEVLALIHLLQSSAWVQLERNTPGGSLWRDLRNPIGAVRILSRRGELGPVRDLETWVRAALPSPGCGGGGDSLTTYDLYNNLIVGYLRSPDFADPGNRRRELSRPYSDPPQDNPLLGALRAVQDEWVPERENELWALSNAERLLRDPWRRHDRTGRPLQLEPWTALNLAQLAESVRPHVPEAGRETLDRQVADLSARALEGRAARGGGRNTRQLGAQRDVLAPALVRMVLLAASRSGRDALGAGGELVPADLLERLEPQTRATAAAVEAALTVRSTPTGRLAAAGVLEAEEGVLPAATAEALETLADWPEGSDWRRALRRDLAAELALRTRPGAPEEERRAWARRAHAVLHWGDEAPPELAAIEEGLGLVWRLQPRALATHPVAAVLVALGAAFLAWLLGRFLARQLRRRHALWTSFYRLEAEEQLK